MSCCRAAARQCLRPRLPRHSFTTSSPLWVESTRHGHIPAPVVAIHRTYASAALDSIANERKSRKTVAAKSTDEKTSTLETSITLKNKRTVSTATSKARKESQKKEETNVALEVPRRRGRPRKTPVVRENPKPRGRPRKTPTDSEVPKRPGRPRKTPVATPAVVDTSGSRRRRSKSHDAIDKLPPRVRYQAKTDNHCDLKSFKKWIKDTNRLETLPLHKGTLFEYQTIEASKRYGLVLCRCGRANDRGIDLIGDWPLPDGQALKALVQCKASKNRPSMIRELEGSWRNAPAGFGGDDVVNILACTHPATKGTVGAIERSQLPMGFMHITSDGLILQFIRNAAAKRLLPGLTVNPTYGAATSKTLDGSTHGGQLSLQWMGKPWVSMSTAEA